MPPIKENIVTGNKTDKITLSGFDPYMREVKGIISKYKDPKTGATVEFKENGTIVYLKVSLETVLERLSNIKTRGVTLEKGQTLEDLYMERIPLYEKHADVVIESEGCTVEELVEQIIDVLDGRE